MGYKGVQGTADKHTNTRREVSVPSILQGLHIPQMAYTHVHDPELNPWIREQALRLCNQFDWLTLSSTPSHLFFICTQNMSVAVNVNSADNNKEWLTKEVRPVTVNDNSNSTKY